MARLFQPLLIKSVFIAWPALLGANCVQAQVQYFNQVPTPAQVRSALGLPTPSQMPLRPGTRRKGIEWKATSPMAESSDSSGRGVAMPVNFDHGTARLSKASLVYVETIANVLAEAPSLRLVVEGHTDVTGPARANTMLSWERAFSVFRVLVDRYGIDPERLQPVGKGSGDPLLPSEPAHAMNRRVQFRVAVAAPA